MIEHVVNLDGLFWAKWLTRLTLVGILVELYVAQRQLAV